MLNKFIKLLPYFLVEKLAVYYCMKMPIEAPLKGYSGYSIFKDSVLILKDKVEDGQEQSSSSSL